MLVSLTDIFGFCFALFLLWNNLKQSRTLTGSFFKPYYRLLILASILLAAGFVSEYLAIRLVNTDLAKGAANLLFLIVVLLYTHASILWPKLVHDYRQQERE